jgi:hypothetical protein
VKKIGIRLTGLQVVGKHRSNFIVSFADAAKSHYLNILHATDRSSLRMLEPPHQSAG